MLAVRSRRSPGAHAFGCDSAPEVERVWTWAPGGQCGTPPLPAVVISLSLSLSDLQ